MSDYDLYKTDECKIFYPKGWEKQSHVNDFVTQFVNEQQTNSIQLMVERIDSAIEQISAVFNENNLQVQNNNGVFKNFVVSQVKESLYYQLNNILKVKKYAVLNCKNTVVNLEFELENTFQNQNIFIDIGSKAVVYLNFISSVDYVFDAYVKKCVIDAFEYRGENIFK